MRNHLFALGCLLVLDACTERGKPAPQVSPAVHAADAAVDARLQLPPVVVGRELVVGEGGPLPPPEIQDVVRPQLPALLRCWNARPVTKIMLKWTNDARGAPTQVELAAPGSGDVSVDRCIEERVKTWRFKPALGGGVVEVSYAVPETPLPAAAVPAKVEQAVHDRIYLLRGCYRRTVSRGFEGSVELSWTIAADGTVTRATAHPATETGDELARCIEETVRGWTFGPRAGAAELDVTATVVLRQR